MKLRKTVLNENHIELGAKMAEFAGFSMPIQYSSVKEEVSSVREGKIFSVRTLKKRNLFRSNKRERRTSDRRPWDVQQTSDEHPTNVDCRNHQSSGRPTDV